MHPGTYRTSIFALAALLMALPMQKLVAQNTQVVTSAHHDVDSLLDQSYHDMYNLQFDEALRQVEAAKRLDKDDPIPWMTQACAILFREFDRLHILRSELFGTDDRFSDGPALVWNQQNHTAFEGALNGSEKLAQAGLLHDKDDPRALFAMTLVNGLRADDAALIEKKKFSALSFTKAANGYAEKLLAHWPNYYDAYLATGLGKYIIGGKAAPIRWMLRLDGLKGDQNEGVKELTLVAEHGHYLLPFARILLAFDDLRHKDKADARKKLEWLHEQFPNNPLFLQEIAKLDHPPAGHGQ
ncbi:MAG TPA: hypothetical protein VJW55_03925 [Candidatus Angelobacter sp.]|nr:hypothetical protein [Candidatus Angelobacter sp.]